MDAVAAYHNWIKNSLVNQLVKYLTEGIERTLGTEKEFIRSDETDLPAAKCSEAMVKEGCCRPFFTKNHNPDEKEFHKSVFSYYNDGAMEQAIKDMAYGFLESPDYNLDFESFPVIGAGIAVERIEADRVRFYATLQLRKEPLKATF